MIALWLLLAAALLWFVYGPLPTIYHKYLHDHHRAGEGPLVTFDDGPDAEYTDRLLTLLDERQVKAVFFPVSAKAAQRPEVLARVAAAGHEIGFHGAVHRNLWFMGYFATKRNFEQGLAELATLGVQPRLYRPPYGNINLFTLHFCRRYGLTPTWWTVIVGDWKNVGGTVIAQRLRAQAGPGDVVLLHDSGDGTGGEPGAPAGTLAALGDWLPRPAVG